MQTLTAPELIAFEANIAREFEAGNIRAPIHLVGGNEEELIKIFSKVNPQDWICSTWRSHYHALLKGIPSAEVKRQIMAGCSMFISSIAHKFLSSAIMGGMLPIACGLASKGDTVWCFVGDMAASIGAFHDAVKFANGYKLAVYFVIEDNGLSTNTPTEEAWGHGIFNESRKNVSGYRYERTWPHTGCGKWVQF